jgi:prepilin-type processing-associated H-X9-DG protein
MNRYLGGASQASVQHPAELPLVFDGLGGAATQEQAAFRHMGGLNVGYADGHARWESKRDFALARFTP